MHNLFKQYSIGMWNWSSVLKDVLKRFEHLKYDISGKKNEHLFN